MTEADLRDLGIVRIPIPVPFPQAGGPVNVYAIADGEGGLLLFDAGLGTPDAERSFADGFAAAGLRFEDVRRIVLSHGHVDHFGAARTVVERAGHPVQVSAHAADLPKVVESGWRWKDRLPHYAAHLGRLGVPAEVVAAMAARLGSGGSYARRLADASPIDDGDLLRAGGLELHALHLPGHTPGMICLWEPHHRLLFSADHLLEKISPNPLIELGPDGEDGRWRPLVAYLESLARVRALDVGLVLPGHGPPFGRHREVIDGLVRFYGIRQGKIRGALAERPRTGYEVTRLLFPAVRPQDLFLALSEAIANVEVLEARGEVIRALEDGAWRFRLAA